MKWNLSIFAILFLLAASAIAQKQDIEYGNPSELKGLTKLFIDTQADTKNYGRLVKEMALTQNPLSFNHF